MKILVTGGAGYIGSITVRELLKQNYEVVVIDNLSSGYQKSLPPDATLIINDINNSKTLEDIFVNNRIDAVVHFAASIQMGESVINPSKYYRNNVVSSLNLFDSMVKYNILKIVFSSTAGIYGNPQTIPIPEDDPKEPTNPYGETKLTIEKILHWYDLAYNLKSISIRYFNAAGASQDGAVGEAHKEESHIIPNAIKVALGQKAQFEIFGKDYDTPDGTCVRDYIHVLDLASSHISAIKSLLSGAASNYYNAGTGNGFSNLQIIDMIKKVSGVDFKVEFKERRPGDASTLIADPSKIKKELAWEPKYSDIETIIKTAWAWHKSHPNGY